MARAALAWLFWVLVAGAGYAWGNQDELTQRVRANANDLKETINKDRALFRRDPERFYAQMDRVLSDILNFRRFALRVMGSHARAATPQQRKRFMETLKRGMFNAYANTLVENAPFQIIVGRTVPNSRDESRARVDLEVRSGSGGVYPLSYSMYRDDKDGRWYIENVIISGVNLGLTFRDRFAQEMTRYGGDIDKVIANWSSKVDEPSP